MELKAKMRQGAEIKRLLKKIAMASMDKNRGGERRMSSPEKNVKARAHSPPAVNNRPCKEHSFLTDVADVRAMEQGLLQLLEDFHSGKLQAFGGTEMFDKMNEIREKQEQLAQLHFDLDLQQDMRRIPSEETRARNYENLKKMIGKLHELSGSMYPSWCRCVIDNNKINDNKSRKVKALTLRPRSELMESFCGPMFYSVGEDRQLAIF